jgi:hypothetical protein
MSAERPRVLVMGAGGRPSGISILRAMDAAPATMLAADIDPYVGACTSSTPSGGRCSGPAMTPASRTTCSRAAGARRSTLWCRPSTASCSHSHAAVRSSPRRASRSCSPPRRRSQSAWEKWALAERCAGALSDWLVGIMYAWPAASMLAADLVRRLESVSHRLAALATWSDMGHCCPRPPLRAYFAELRRAEMALQKTEKTATVGNLA